MLRTGRAFVSTEFAEPRARLIAVLGVAVLGLAVAAIQYAIHWNGGHAEFLLLAGANAFLAALATLFFNIRWRALGDPFDRQVRNVFLPISCHFALLLAMEAAGFAPEITQPIVQASWVVSQLLAATILLSTFRGGGGLSPGTRILRTAAALTFSAGVWGLFQWLRARAIVVSIDPLEAGLATVFILAAGMPLLGGGDRRQRREVWLGAAFLLTGIAHLEISWSHEIYDGPFMWGYVLLALSLTAPIVGAVLENVTLLESQTALADRLKRLRKRTDILLDTLPVPVLSVDRARNLRFANRAASALFEVPRGLGTGIEGPGWLERIHPHDRPQVHAAVAPILDEDQSSWEEVVRTEDSEGGVHWLNMQMHQVIDPVVNETLVQVVATEVTDLQLARRAAEARQSRLAFLSNLAQTVTGEVEDQRILDHFLEMSAEILPIRSSLLYRPLADGSGLRLVAGTGPGIDAFEDDRLHPIRAGKHPCWLAFDDGFPYAATIAAAVPPHLAERAATTHDIRHLSYLPLLAAGRTVGVLVITSGSPFDLAAEDINLLNQVGFLLGGSVYLSQLVRELDEQRAVAFEASRLKSEFLANTSHELRTPLTAILGFLRLIIDGAVKDPDKEKEFLVIAHESAEKLLNLINDVLDLAKIEAGRLEVHHEPVPVRSVLEDIESLFQHQMKSKELDFRINFPEANTILWADQDRSLQILTNLLSNAMKFTPRGGSITIACAAENGEMHLTVADTGSGMAPGELEKVFSSFYQVDGSTTREHGGTGLGLTISRRLAELMGGTLGLESPGIDQGTTAHLRLQEYTGS
ncbi:MAG: ATP-binding protein [Thermoanaerobaculales bacterium]